MRICGRLASATVMRGRWRGRSRTGWVAVWRGDAGCGAEMPRQGSGGEEALVG